MSAPIVFCDASVHTMIVSDNDDDGILITPTLGSKRWFFRLSNACLSSSVGVKRTLGLAKRRKGPMSSDNLGTESMKYEKNDARDKASFFVAGKGRFLIFSNFSPDSEYDDLDTS